MNYQQEIISLQIRNNQKAYCIYKLYWCWILQYCIHPIVFLNAALTLDPLIGAISAGNVVVLKPSELSPACSSFLAETIPKYLDPKSIKVIEGGIDVCKQLLQQNWDKIFFTGTTSFLSNCILKICCCLKK